MSNERQGRAHAPYNFIPLPDQVVAAEQPLPDHDRYYPDRHTGYFDVTLTTETPLYIRGMLTEQQATDKERHKNKPDFFQWGGKPIIPGSSLRGMLRTLVEIISFAKMTRVSDKPKIFFRAVAARQDDPLGEHYKRVIGQLGAYVQAGYLIREGKDWFIQPASRRKGKTFIKVRDLNKAGEVSEDVKNVAGLIHLNSEDYKIQYWDVVLDGDIRETRSGYFVGVRSPGTSEQREGVLVCTGNMAESSTARRGRVSTNRRNFTLVFEPDSTAEPLQIAPEAVEDYLDGLTPFQKEEPFDEEYGCLVEGRPVFYVLSQQGDRVYYFGHAPFSRIPAMLTYADEEGKEQQRAVTPRDFIPTRVGENATHYDIAEALFGYVDKGVKNTSQGDKARAYASRIAVTDARPINDQSNVESEFTPKILGGPKPTTFQHYLKQPDDEQTAKPDLKHYAHSKQDTKLRGYKLYWRQKGITVEQVEETDQKALRKIAEQNDTQHTRMCPVKPKVGFSFRVYFENLSDVELGALAWALTLPGSAEHRHQLGMGKPYGMGVVRLDAKLRLSARRERYMNLLSEWDKEPGDEQPDGYIERFEKYICAQIGSRRAYKDIPRINELLIMLTARQPSGNTFQYMLIEGPNDNEYKERPVLPKPSELFVTQESASAAQFTVGDVVEGTISRGGRADQGYEVKLGETWDEQRLVFLSDGKPHQENNVIYILIEAGNDQNNLGVSFKPISSKDAKGRRKNN